ncbi:MAG: OmpA family protein [Bryobacteraceae bacterium]
MLVKKSKGGKPTYYYLFVSAYADGVMPERLQTVVTKDRALTELVVISPQEVQDNMTFVSAEDMWRSLSSSGAVALYGIYFDTDEDKLRPDSEPLLKEIAKLLSSNPELSIHVVGHTDNQGKPALNLDLSRRRAAAVVRELESRFSVPANRLDSFGCGLYAPVASNDSEEGRAKNRRVELVSRPYAASLSPDTSACHGTLCSTQSAGRAEEVKK